MGHTLLELKQVDKEWLRQGIRQGEHGGNAEGMQRKASRPARPAGQAGQQAKQAKQQWAPPTVEEAASLGCDEELRAVAVRLA